MKVRDLIRQLGDHDPDAEVVVRVGEGYRILSDKEIGAERMMRSPNSGWVTDYDKDLKTLKWEAINAVVID
jgi:hypothetical protein